MRTHPLRAAFQDQWIGHPDNQSGALDELYDTESEIMYETKVGDILDAGLPHHLDTKLRESVEAVIDYVINRKISQYMGGN